MKNTSRCLRSSWALAGMVFLLPPPLGAASGAGGAGAPFNVLLLMTDEHTPRVLGCYGDPVVKTPTLDHLAATGVRFTAAYCQNPICVPSRVSLVSGRMASNLGTFGNIVDQKYEGMTTLADAFVQAGYQAAWFGKTHWGDPRFPAASRGAPGRRAAREESEESIGRLPQESQVARFPKEKNPEHLVANEALAFLDQNRDRRFFLGVSFVKPHFPFTIQQEFYDLYRGRVAPPRASPQVIATLPAVSREERQKYRHADATAEDVLRTKAIYYGMVTYVDEEFGRILRRLEQLGLRDRTIIVYTSDHGEMLGDRGIWYKNSFYDGSAGIPFIWSAPKLLPSGRVVATPAMNLDIFPTLVDLCGLPLPAGLEGSSLRPVLLGTGDGRDRIALSENYRGGYAGRMIRTDRWKYFFYTNGEEFLYDLPTDPFEETNLATQPALRRVVDDLKARASAGWISSRRGAGARTTPGTGSPAAPDAASLPAPVVLHPNGGWCWFQDERAIVLNERLYFGSLAGSTRAGFEAGDVVVTSLDLRSRQTASFTLHPRFQCDDHDVPALLALPDGRLLATYQSHGQSQGLVGPDLMRWRRTLRPHDISAWTDERTLPVGAGVSYSNLFRLPAEGGRILNFHRGLGFNPNYLVSTDDGATFSYGGRLLSWPRRPEGDPRFTGISGGRPYLKYAQHGPDTLHFVATEDHPSSYDNSLYHAFIRGGQLHHSDGRPLGPLSRTAETTTRPTDLTCLFRGDVDHVAWMCDLHVDRDGRPRVVFSVQRGGAAGRGKRNNPADGMDLRYHYARWDGAAWHVNEVAHAGSRLYAGEDDYAGLAAIDPQAPDTVFISTNADPATGTPLQSAADGRRHWEIFRGDSSDQGRTFRWHAVTRDSTADNLRPIIPIWPEAAGRRLVLWLRGTYRKYTDYDLEVLALLPAR